MWNIDDRHKTVKVILQTLLTETKQIFVQQNVNKQLQNKCDQLYEQVKIDQIVTDKESSGEIVDVFHQPEIIAESIASNNYEILKAFLTKWALHNEPTAEYQELKAFIDVISQESLSVDKYNQLENLVDNLTENSVSSKYVDESIKKVIIFKANELKELCEKSKEIETMYSSMQSFVHEIKKIKGPAVKEVLQTQLPIINTLKNECEANNRKLNNQISVLDKTLNNKVAQLIVNNLFKELPQ